MRTYQEILEGYRRRRHDGMLDAVTAGLSLGDKMLMASAPVREAEMLPELAGIACSMLPFAVIAAQEGRKVLLGLKPVSIGIKDGAVRMMKTGAAISAGRMAAAGAGGWTAMPVTLGVRLVLERHRSRLLVNVRISSRISRLQELNQQLREVQQSGDCLPV